MTVRRSRDRVREEYDITESDVVFVICGRITREKGFDVLAQAIPLLDNVSKKHFKLLVVGEGDYMNVFQQIIADNGVRDYVIFVGATHCVADYLNASDACILPSYHENLPISLLEAGSMGLPCVASKVGGIPEIIVDGETGFLIDSHSPHDYAKAMDRLIMDSDLRKRMQMNIARDIQSRFSVKKMCDKIKELYK